MRLTKEERKDIKEIRDLLVCAFLWEATPQGRKYWEKVDNNLRDITKKSQKSTTTSKKKSGHNYHKKKGSQSLTKR